MLQSVFRRLHRHRFVALAFGIVCCIIAIGFIFFSEHLPFQRPLRSFLSVCNDVKAASLSETCSRQWQSDDWNATCTDMLSRVSHTDILSEDDCLVVTDCQHAQRTIAEQELRAVHSCVSQPAAAAPVNASVFSDTLFIVTTARSPTAACVAATGVGPA